MAVAINSYGSPVEHQRKRRRFEEERAACIRHIERMIDRARAHLREREDFICLEEEINRRTEIARLELVLEHVRTTPA